MIKSNLAAILKEKEISIRELSNLTGINRASLTQLANNESKMIKFETLEKLVHYLNVPIAELITYVPESNVEITNFKYHKEKGIVTCELFHAQKNLSVKTYGKIYEEDDIYRIKWPYLIKGQDTNVFLALMSDIFLTFSNQEAQTRIGENDVLMATLKLLSVTLIDKFMNSYPMFKNAVVHDDSGFRMNNLTAILDFQIAPIRPLLNEQSILSKEPYLRVTLPNEYFQQLRLKQLPSKNTNK